SQMIALLSRSAFNPFTHAVAATYNEDISDSWGSGFAVNGVNNFNLGVNRHFDQYADLPFTRHDGSYQPFVTAFATGGEFDPKKIREVSGHIDIPIPGINEMFDLDGRFMAKSFGAAIVNSAIEFPLTLSDPNERAPYTFRYAVWAADRHMQYGHVVPNVNLFLIEKDKIMRRLKENRLNPTMIG
ncbi:hypothetical protein PMAYCL1PPCAC_00016, partial [Pristionchus mayeri]